MSIKKLFLSLTTTILPVLCASLTAAEIKMDVEPSGGKYLYDIGDTVVYEIAVEGLNEKKDSYELAYRLSLDEAVTLDEGTVKLKNGKATLRGSLGMQGFLRCNLTLTTASDTIREASGCGFDVEAILPTGLLPANYEDFWRLAKIELLRIPVDPRIEEIEAVDPGDAHRYKFSLAHPDGGRVYGFLHVPEGEGPFPTILSIPGSGVGRSGRFAKFPEGGFAVFSIEILGLNPSKEVVGGIQGAEPADSTIMEFRQFQDGLLKGYHGLGKDDPYHYFHRRSMIAALRAMDYIVSRTDIVDTTRVGVYGGSQGGGLAILLASVDKRVKAVTASVPGFCDHTAFLYGRAGRGPRRPANQQEIRALSYYDAALAASLVDVPTYISVGFEDPTCHPTKVYAAFNNLRGPKKINNMYRAGHGSPPGWRLEVAEWFRQQFGM